STTARSSRKRTACSARRSSVPRGTGSAIAVSTSGSGSRASSVNAVASRSLAPRYGGGGRGPTTRPPPAPPTRSLKAAPSRLGYLLDLAPKDLEKIIYFAAYLITSVDTDARHRDMSTVESEIGVERKRVEDKRDADVEARQKKLETDIAELEAEGAKSDVR